MGINWRATSAGVALALFAVACSEVTPPTKSPGVRSNEITITGTTVNYTGNGFTNGVLNSSFCTTPQGGGPGLRLPIRTPLTCFGSLRQTAPPPLNCICLMVITTWSMSGAPSSLSVPTLLRPS